jgi:hypothetical protein
MLRILAVAMALLALGNARGGATSWVAPDRAITPEEKLAGMLAASPLVLVGHMTSVYDTIVANGPPSGTRRPSPS